MYNSYDNGNNNDEYDSDDRVPSDIQWGEDFDDIFRNSAVYEADDDVPRGANTVILPSWGSTSTPNTYDEDYDLQYRHHYKQEQPPHHGVGKLFDGFPSTTKDNDNYNSSSNANALSSLSHHHRHQPEHQSPDLAYQPIYLPLVPCVLLPTHISTRRSVGCIVSGLSALLTRMDISFEFSSNCAEFNSVLATAGRYVKFAIRIFAADPSGNDLGNALCNKEVELQHYAGDRFTFGAIFAEVRSCLEDMPIARSSSGASTVSDLSADCMPITDLSPELASGLASSRRTSFSASAPDESIGGAGTGPAATMDTEDPLGRPLTTQEVTEMLHPIRRMVQTGASMESQLEGCRLMSDLIVSNTNFHSQLLDFGCVEMLVRLSLSSNFLTCQQAILALGELSNSTADASTGTRCVQLIWDAVHDNAEQYGKFVDLLCAQVTDGPYYTECRRRQGAQLLVTMLEHSLKHHEAACGSLTSSAASSTAASSARVNIEKYRRHLAVVNDRIVTPRSAKGKNMGGATGFPQSLSATPANSSGSAASRQSSYGAYAVPSYAGPGEPLQDAQLEQCASAIASYMERICPSSA